MNFSRLLKGELKKTAKPKTLVILAIVLLVAFVIMIFAFSLFVSAGELLPKEDWDEIKAPSFNAKFFKNKSEAEESLALLRSKLEEEERSKAENPNAYYGDADVIYNLKASIAAVESIRDNALYGRDVPIYLGESGSILNAVVGAPNGYDFTEFAASFLGLVLTIYLITVGAGILVNELRSGSIKLLMLRPVSKNEVTSAKLAATAIYGVVLYSICFLLAFAYGAIRYGAPVAPTLYVFNAVSAFLAPRGFALFLTWLSGIVTMLSFSLLAYTVGLLFKNAVAGMGAAIVSSFGVVQLLFNLFGGGRFLLSYQGNFNEYFSASNSLYGGSDFYLMIGMLAVWWILMLAVSYVVYEKRDVV